MARKITQKPNTDAPDANYPYGNIRDNDGSNNGTPVDVVVYGDMHQFFDRLMSIAGVTANGLPDNQPNGFQLFDSLISTIRKTFSQRGSAVTDLGVARENTSSEVLNGTAWNPFNPAFVSAERLWELFGAWTSDTSTTKWSYSGGGGSVVFSSQTVKYKKINKTLFVEGFTNFGVTGTVDFIHYDFPTGFNRASNIMVDKSIFAEVGGVVYSNTRMTISATNPMQLTFSRNLGIVTQFNTGVFVMRFSFVIEID